MNKVCVSVYMYTYTHTRKHTVDWGEGDFCNHGKPIRILSLSVTTFQVHFTRVWMSLETHTDLPSLACAKSCHQPTCYCVHSQGGSRASSSRSFGRPEESPHSEPVQDNLDGKRLKELRTNWPFVWLRNGLFLPWRQVKHVVGFAVCFSL